MTQLTVNEFALRQGTTYALARGHMLYLLKAGKITQIGMKHPESVSGRGRPAKLFMFYDDNDCLVTKGVNCE